MKKCSFCAEEIQDEAIKCKHCGEMLNNQNSLNLTKTIERKKMGCGSWLVLAVLLAVFINWITSCGNTTTTTTKSDIPDNITICVTAQQYVEHFLKAPGSAKFPSCHASTIENLGNKKYRVTSYVDSQNSFGALLRLNYTVLMEYKGNDRFQLIDVNTNE